MAPVKPQQIVPTEPLVLGQWIDAAAEQMYRTQTSPTRLERKAHARRLNDRMRRWQERQQQQGLRPSTA
jgi:hypothetical protein